jgi:hypothetical protein
VKKIVFGLIILLVLKVMIDLTPNNRPLPAEQELITPYIPGERPLGETIGGLQMFSNVFKRGYGDKVFGSDENGIWLGGSDYDKGKFKVNMSGEAEMKSVTLVDENDQTFIDAKGLVSTANFSSDMVKGSGSQTTTSTSYVDVSGLSINITVDRTQKVFIFATMVGVIMSGNSVNVLNGRILLDNSVQVGATMYMPGRYFSSSGAHIDSTSSTQELVELSPGTHTVKLQFKVLFSSDTGQINRSDCILGYILMGK